MTIHFDHSIVKTDKDGNRVISSYIAPGETLENGQTYDDIADTHGIGPANDVHVLSDEEATEEGQGLTDDETHTSTVAENQTDPTIVPNTGELNEEQKAAAAAQGISEEDAAKQAGGVDPNAKNDDENKDDENKDAAPSKSALKDEWFEYAKKQGFEGEEGDLTKEQFIEQYGPKED